MKLNETAIEVSVTEGLTTSNFGISLEDAPHILVILRDKLYSNKVQAVVREYSTNAIDAHVESGKKDLPIHVTLPSRYDPLFKVRDFGTGLDEDGIRNIYAKYGKSTKRNSNDSIGQLGLGCKSGFAYNDSFTITSWINGKKTVYSAYIDPTGLGAITQLGQEESNEDAGIEIAIPVRSVDVEAFRNEARNVYKFFAVKPIFHNADDFILKPDNKNTMLAQSQHGWYICEDANRGYSGYTPIAIMGNIGYPINALALPELKEIHKKLLQTGIRIQFAIGELSISANREALEYTPLTKDTILKRLNAILKEIKEEFEAKIASAKTQYEARQLIGDIQIDNHTDTYQYFRKEFLRTANLSWNGTTIGGTRIQSKEWTTHNLTGFCVHYGTAYRSYVSQKRLKKDHQHEYNVTSKLYIAFAETDLDKQPSRASEKFDEVINARGNLAKDGVTVAVFVGKKTDWDAYCKATNLVAANWTDLSTIVPPPPAPRIKTGKVHNNKHKHKVFKLNLTNAGFNHGVKSKDWDAAETDDQIATYVELDHFFWSHKNRRCTAYDIFRWINRFKDSDIDLTKMVVYGIKKTEIDKVPKTWITFEQRMVNEINDYLAKHKVGQVLVDHNTFLNHFKNLPNLYADITKKLPPTLLITEYVSHMLSMSHPDEYKKYMGIMQLYREFIGDDSKAVGVVKPSHNLDSELQQVIRKYPLLYHLGWGGAMYHLGYGVRTLETFEQYTDRRNAILDYIKLIERL